MPILLTEYFALARKSILAIPDISRLLVLWIIALTASTAPAQAQISNPTQISGAVLWAEADDVNGNGIQPADGQIVTSWVDKSGNNNHLTASAAEAPTFAATGFDAVNPAIRVAPGKFLAGPNPFAGPTLAETTIFIVFNNVTVTKNFVVSLNGENNTNTSVNGRFSFHMPWFDNRIYFDAGGCCTALTRMSGVYPVAATSTALISAQVNANAPSRLLRINANPFRSAGSANTPTVSGGVRIGSMPNLGYPFDGHFAEIVIYDRALSIAEIQQVECYLMAKWMPWLNASCVPQLSIGKVSQIWDGSADEFALPGNDLIYTVTVTKSPGNDVTPGSLLVIDRLPPEMVFYNDDPDGAGPLTQPVSFVDNGSGLSWNYATAAAFSDSSTRPTSFSDCTYTPSAGYDPNVQHICVEPSGAFSGNNTSFSLKYRARIK